VAAALLAAVALAGCASGHAATLAHPPRAGGARSTTSTSLGEPANLAPTSSTTPASAGCPAAWSDAPLLPCRDVPPGLSPDLQLAGSTCEAVAPSIPDCTAGVSEGFAVAAKSPSSVPAVLASAALSFPTRSEAETAAQSLGHSFSGSQTFTRDPAAPAESATYAVALITWPHHVGAIAIEVVGTTVLEVYLRVAKAAPSSTRAELKAPALIVRLLADQVAQLRQVGPPA